MICVVQLQALPLLLWCEGCCLWCCCVGRHVCVTVPAAVAVAERQRPEVWSLWQACLLHSQLLHADRSSQLLLVLVVVVVMAATAPDF
jgi:hypothetical protein